MTRLLTESEFNQTFTNKMFDFTGKAKDVVDVWPYFDQLSIENVEENVSHVYRNENSTFDHVLFGTSIQNQYLVIVVDLINHQVYGHHLLDLTNKYE